MQIVILAAGRGTRMKDLTENTPKPMLQINGKPILAYKVESLPREIDEVIFVIGYLGDQIKNYFGNFYNGKKISYAVQEELNGSAAAIHLVKNILEDDFLVMNGDDLYLKSDIENVMKHEIAALGLEVNDPSRFGVFKFDEKGNLIDIIEKPKMKGPALANIGLYKLKKDFFDYPRVVIPGGEYGLPQTMMQMKNKYTIAVEKATAWLPIGNPDDLEKAKEEISKYI